MRALTSFLDDMAQKDEFVNSKEFTNAGAHPVRPALSASELLQSLDKNRPPPSSSPSAYELHPLVSQVLSTPSFSSRDFASAPPATANSTVDDDDDAADDEILKSLLSKSRPASGASTQGQRIADPPSFRAPPPPDRPTGRIHLYYPTPASSAAPASFPAPAPAAAVAPPAAPGGGWWPSSFAPLVSLPLSGARSLSARLAYFAGGVDGTRRAGAEGAKSAAAATASDRADTSNHPISKPGDDLIISSTSQTLGLSRSELSALRSLPLPSSSSASPSSRLPSFVRRYRALLSSLLLLAILWAMTRGGAAVGEEVEVRR